MSIFKVYLGYGIQNSNFKIANNEVELNQLIQN